MKKEINSYTVDLSGVDDRGSLHRRLEEALMLPSWYGSNLDALYDALTEVSVPMHVLFTAWEKLQEEEPVYFNRFRAVLSDVEKELPGSSFVFSQESEEAEGSDESGMMEEFEEDGDSFFTT